jgi:F-type H+-transporting ATPase subunit b
MFARLRTSAFFLAATAAPLLALAAEEHDKQGAIASTKQGVATSVTALVVFALVFGVLATKVWPVITRALDERADKITGEIAAAEQARREAKEALDQYQKSLAQARAEAQKMLEQTKTEQLALAAGLKAKADQELGALRERATRDIEAAKRAAIAEIYSEATSLATAVASKILRREIRPEDQRQLVEESLRQLQSARN